MIPLGINDLAQSPATKQSLVEECRTGREPDPSVASVR